MRQYNNDAEKLADTDRCPLKFNTYEKTHRFRKATREEILTFINEIAKNYQCWYADELYKEYGEKRDNGLFRDLVKRAREKGGLQK